MLKKQARASLVATRLFSAPLEASGLEASGGRFGLKQAISTLAARARRLKQSD
jgi:hypothetical protein